eukprot:1044780-Amphidinium_carterae.1
MVPGSCSAQSPRSWQRTRAFLRGCPFFGLRHATHCNQTGLREASCSAFLSKVVRLGLNADSLSGSTGRKYD